MAEVSAENLTERIIRNLEEGSAFFDTEELRRNYSSLVAKIKAGAKLAITGIELLCKVCGYLFDPEEGYVALKNQIVALLSWMAETLDLREDIPRDVRPKLDEMNGYLTKIQELIDKIGQDIAELIQVVEEKALESDFNIDRKELKKIRFTQNKIDRDRSVCIAYLGRAQMAFDEIEKKVTGRVLLLLVGSAASFATGTVLAKTAVMSALAALTPATAAAGTVAAGTAAAGTVAAGTAAAGTAAAGTAAAGTAAAGTVAAGTAAAGTVAAGTAAAGTAAAGTAAAGTAAAGTVASGTVAGGTAASGTAGTGWFANLVGYGTAAAGTLVIWLKLFFSCLKYAEWWNEFKETLQGQLNTLNMRFLETEKDVELLEKNLSEATD